MATENDKIPALQANAKRCVCTVMASFSLFIIRHFISAFSRMKILPGETRPDRHIGGLLRRIRSSTSITINEGHD